MESIVLDRSTYDPLEKLNKDAGGVDAKLVVGWAEAYKKKQEEYNNGPRDGNLQPSYLGIHHSCLCAQQWYGVDPAIQEPKQSSIMVIEDQIGRGVYIGDRRISSYIDSDDYKDKVVQKTVEMKAEPNQENLNLTYPEQLILHYTKQAWDNFINLEGKTEDDIVEFKDAVHRLQQLIALRVARRVDTAVWLQPND